MKRIRDIKIAKRNTVEDRGSLEKLVDGVSVEITLSCITEKSSIQFCKSRMLRKKSFDSSLTGFTVGAGANGGPSAEYGKVELEFVIEV